MVRTTEYSVIEETLARRTFDESGDYTVRPFQFVAKECVTVNENVGVFTAGATTDDGNTASSSLLELQVSPGKAYIHGYEIEKMAPSFKDVNKSRDFETVNAGISTFNLGNFAFITNIYGSPDITFISGEADAFKKIQLYDDVTSTRGSASGNLIGVARARAAAKKTTSGLFILNHSFTALLSFKSNCFLSTDKISHFSLDKRLNNALPTIPLWPAT